MEQENRQIRWLLAAAAVLGAVIIAYNVLFVPQVVLTTVVYTDTPSSPVLSAVASSTPQEEANADAEEDTVPVEEEYVPEAVGAGQVNVNTATSEELQSLPGVGPVMAERIIEYRERYGAFQSTQELLEVSGIGEKTLEQLQDLITI